MIYYETEHNAINRHPFTNTLMIVPFILAAPVKEVADLNGFDQGPLGGGQRDIIRKSTRLEINL